MNAALTLLTLMLLAAGGTSIAWATPPSSHALGARFAVLSKGETTSIDVRLTPSAHFDSVSVEAGSGVASMSPPCQFSEVDPGASYDCRIEVSAQPGTASFTLNVVGQRAGSPGQPRVFEVSHFTLATGVPATGGPVASARSARQLRTPVRGLILTRPKDP